MQREAGSARTGTRAPGSEGAGDATLRAVLAAVAGKYEILGEMGHGVDGTIAYLARELNSSRLVVLRLDPANSEDGGVLTVLREVSASLPGGGSSCPDCGAPGLGWGRYCATCGADLAGPAPLRLHGAAGGLPDARPQDPAGFQLLGSVPREGARGGGDVVFARELVTGSVVALAPPSRTASGAAAAPRILHTLAALTAIPLATGRGGEQLGESEPAEPLPRAQPTAHRTAPQEVLLPSDDLALPDDRLPPRPATRIARWWIAPAALLVAAVIGLGAFVKARAARPDGTDAYVGSGGMGVAAAPAVRRNAPDSPPARADSGFLRIGGDLPAGYTVTIDDLPLTRESLALVPGEYVLAARAPGYDSYSERLTLESGQTLVWTPALSRADSGVTHSSSAPVEPRPAASASKKPAQSAKNAPTKNVAEKTDSPATTTPAATVAQSCQESFDAKSWASAATLCEKEARAGSVTAQRNLGVMYDRGVGVERDPARAAQWLRAAAESGSRDAAFQLGAMYETGRGVAADASQSVSWYRRAALLGDRAAQVKVGKAYEAGNGVASDMGEALTWYRKAAGQGDAWAQNYIGFLYGNGKGVPHDDVEALKWFRQAATNGNAQAEYNVGFMYANGRGVRRDDAEALRWYRMAARDGYDEAKRELERRGIEP